MNRKKVMTGLMITCAAIAVNAVASDHENGAIQHVLTSQRTAGMLN